jgi:ethanolamine-phosphate cytidylyltransferase
VCCFLPLPVCVAATEEQQSRMEQAGTKRAAPGPIPTASSGSSYHATVDKIAAAIEGAIAAVKAEQSPPLEAHEFAECSRAAVRQVRKKQDDFAGSTPDDGASDASGSTWKSGLSAANPSAKKAKKGTKEKPVRVYVDGCFDIMHSGHYNVLRQARQLGDVLIAGVHSTEEIMRNKGPPVMTDDERVKIVQACKWVDEVAFGTPYQPSVKTLDDVNADFCVHGDDLPVGADGGPHAYWDVQQAGRLQLVKRTEGVSTTDLVGRLLLATSEHLQQRNAPSSDSPASLLNPAEDEDKAHYARNIGSNFLPTSWRIAQFSNSRAPTAEDTVVYIDGSWDLFHVGHVEILQAAKALGSFLLVGVHDDPTINRSLGKNYPIMNLHERVLNVLSCGHVDDVIIGAPWTVSEDMITTFNIQKVVALEGGVSAQSATGLDTDPYKLAKAKGLFSVLKLGNVLTNDMLVERIVSHREKYVNRNKSREAKELDYLENAKEFVAEVQRPRR